MLFQSLDREVAWFVLIVVWSKSSLCQKIWCETSIKLFDSRTKFLLVPPSVKLGLHAKLATFITINIIKLRCLDHLYSSRLK
mmetsp:Transcript_9/g.17  ORF Transcript_9/g.17 Transcript_9/m.17 type:complete len:82 (+) Transcript_9:1093-1338(+)